MKEEYQCIVKICGNRGSKLVGAVCWKKGYLPFAVFDWKEDPRISDSRMIHPDIIGSYHQIEFYGVNEELKAVKPVWLIEVEKDGKDEDTIFFDLSIYEAWLKKYSMPIPGPINKEVFKAKLKSDKRKSYHKLSQSKMAMI